MPGTLTITTLSDGTNSTSATNCIQGSARAWINFNGSSTGVIRAQYNVSAITYLAAGQFRITFASAMTDANYVVVFGAGGADQGRGQLYLLPTANGVTGTPEGTNKTATFVEVGGNQSTNPNAALPSFNVAIYR